MKFEDGDVTELTANATAESMYAMCDKNGDHFLLFDAIVDHKKNNKAMTRTEQSSLTPERSNSTNARQKFGKFVLGGRMELLLGKSSLISKSATLYRQPNMPRQMTSTLNPLSTIGFPTH